MFDGMMLFYPQTKYLISISWFGTPHFFSIKYDTFSFIIFPFCPGTLFIFKIAVSTIYVESHKVKLKCSQCFIIVASTKKLD